MPLFMTQARKVAAIYPARPDIASAINGGVNIAAFVRDFATHARLICRAPSTEAFTRWPKHIALRSRGPVEPIDL